LGFSRRFKAVSRIGALFAGVWGAIATVVGMLGNGTFHPSLFLPSLLTFGVIFGAAGGISGISTALLIARGESERDPGEVSVLRMTAWGFLGGSGPGAVFSLLALGLGATDVVGLLLAVSLLSGGLGSAISGSAAFTAKRVGPGGLDDERRFPAT
jgi:hypothetical protein